MRTRGRAALFLIFWMQCASGIRSWYKCHRIRPKTVFGAMLVLLASWTGIVGYNFYFQNFCVVHDLVKIAANKRANKGEAVAWEQYTRPLLNLSFPRLAFSIYCWIPVGDEVIGGDTSKILEAEVKSQYISFRIPRQMNNSSDIRTIYSIKSVSRYFKLFSQSASLPEGETRVDSYADQREYRDYILFCFAGALLFLAGAILLHKIW